MCGIYGYSGYKRNATAAVMDGLRRLDYRGYDSWGVSVLKASKILTDKHVGIVDGIKSKLPDSSVAIGHTRWATNGAVTVGNAHPHYAMDRSFVLAHNGIVENFIELKKDLVKKGYRFSSETDSEVIVHLIEEMRKVSANLVSAVRKAFKKLAGRNTIVLLDNTGQIIGARNGSPLVVGLSKDTQEVYVSSDTLSFAPYVDDVVVLDNNEMVVCDKGKISLLEIKNGKSITAKREKNSVEDGLVGKEGYNHYMLKEIYEEPFVIKRVIDASQSSYAELAKVIKKARSVYCIGSGTAGAAAFQLAYYLRTISGIPAVGLIGAEAMDYIDLVDKKDLFIALSQSGETADVIEVLEKVKEKGAKLASFVNMPGSMITRLSDYKFMAQAGPEICVMSTKIFVSQLSWSYMVAKSVAGKYSDGQKVLSGVAKKVTRLLKDKSLTRQVKSLAKNLSRERDIFLLSKGQNLQIVKEGMVKLTEGAYIHAHAIPAGDLKHYAITLMEPGKPVLFVLSEDEAKTDVLSAIHEVKARGARIIAISQKPEREFDDFIKVPNGGEASAIVNIIPLQLLAYYLAVILGHNVDKPRNIAKSVTVK